MTSRGETRIGKPSPQADMNSCHGSCSSCPRLPFHSLGDPSVSGRYPRQQAGACGLGFPRSVRQERFDYIFVQVFTVTSGVALSL